MSSSPGLCGASWNMFQILTFSTCITDHTALRYVFSRRIWNPGGRRWKYVLQNWKWSTTVFYFGILWCESVSPWQSRWQACLARTLAAITELKDDPWKANKKNAAGTERSQTNRGKLSASKSHYIYFPGSNYLAVSASFADSSENLVDYGPLVKISTANIVELKSHFRPLNISWTH